MIVKNSKQEGARDRVNISEHNFECMYAYKHRCFRHYCNKNVRKWYFQRAAGTYEKYTRKRNEIFENEREKETEQTVFGVKTEDKSQMCKSQANNTQTQTKPSTESTVEQNEAKVMSIFQS